MARRVSVRTQTPTSDSFAKSAASGATALLSNWVARAFSAGTQSNRRRHVSRNRMVVESLETRVMLSNQPPVIVAAANPGTTIWNTTKTFSGANAFSVSDPDAGAAVVEATLTGTNNTVSLSGTTGLTFSVGDGTGDATMTFTGTLANINAALNGMSVFTGGIVGGSTVALTVNDLGNTGTGGAQSATSSVNWFNTFTEFDAGTGILKLYGLETNETSTLFVDGDLTVVGFSVNGVDFTTGIDPASVVETYIFLRGGDDTFNVAGTAANLVVRQIDAGAGIDTLNASALVNAAGNLEILGQAGRDFITGSQGNDTINGGEGSDQITGGAGNDTLIGGIGSEVYFFNASIAQGSDQIVELVGGGGNDELNFSATTAATNLTINLGSTAAQVLSAGLTIQLNDATTFEAVVGGQGNDVLNGTAGFNRLDGSGGNDTLNGLGNIDQLTGGAGNDIMNGGTGDDFYFFNADESLGSDQAFELAGEGTDTLDFGSTSSASVNVDLRSTLARVIAATLTLQLNSGSTFENVNGGGGNDTLIGNALNNVFFGFGGNDNIFGLQGDDTYQGSEGNDTYNFDADSQLNADSFLFVDNGVDTINLFTTTTLGTTLNLGTFNANQVVNANLSLNISSDTIIENILGTDLVDNYTGNAADNQFDLRGGNDIAVGLLGSDRFIGGAGNDTLTGNDGDDTYVFDADLAEGTDTLVEAATLAGGVDTLDFIATGVVTNNLNIDLRIAGVQVIRAAAVSLSLGASNNFENVIAGAGNDTVIGNNLANSLRGSGGNDLIFGLAANDTLDGGLGNDTYMFDADSNIGSDTVIDAGGTDTLNWLATTTGSGVAINLDSTATQNDLFVSDFHILTLATVNSIENVIGTNQADTIFGNSLINVLTANGGDDFLEGLGGNDTLVGGSGNDLYRFNVDNVLGNDLLNEAGGGLNDILDFSPTLVTNLKVDLRIAGFQAVAAGKLNLSLQNATAYEVVIGGGGNDLIIGSTVNNFLNGLGGNDTIYGQGGNDFLSGGEGNDTLVGEAGRDVILGGNGADVINGGTEADLIIGGTTTYDLNTTAIPAIVSIWTGAGSYATRVAAVQTGANPLNNLTVFNDGAIDVLRGGTGTTDDQLDLFFSSALDTLPDFGTGLETNVVV